MRTLRAYQVPVYGLKHSDPSIANASRHCAGTFDAGANGRPVGKPQTVIVEELLEAGRQLGQGTILVPGSDEWSVFVAVHAQSLSSFFSFPKQPLALVEGLASKQGLHELALRHGLATPAIVAPADVADVVDVTATLTYPVMLKPVESLPGSSSVALAASPDELLSRYREMAQSRPVLIQEYIPGADTDVWIFNGYFDSNSRCLAAFTGRKIRQHPAHMGLCAFGVAEQNQEVIDQTTRFLSALGYQGVVDIGYRWDRRDGSYKVLDINPRLGGAFRMFVDRNGLDVARAMYLDLTGRPVPQMVPKDGRKWMLEAGELISYGRYRRDTGLTFGAWLRSLRGLEEGATFSLADPLPFVAAMRIVARDTIGGGRRVSTGQVARRLLRRRAPAAAREGA